MLSGPPLFFLLTLDVVSSPNIQLARAPFLSLFIPISPILCVLYILPGGVELRPSLFFFYPLSVPSLFCFLLFIPTIQLYTHTYAMRVKGVCDLHSLRLESSSTLCWPHL
jgi:hypothetical protein